MTRHARRLARRLASHDAGGNNEMISTPIAASVPIVSQRGIDPIKTAISLLLALVTTTALTEPPPLPKPRGRHVTREQRSGWARFVERLTRAIEHGEERRPGIIAARFRCEDSTSSS